jgi:sucrose phosphorylase
MQTEKRILNHLTFLYGEDDAEQIWQQLHSRLEQFQRTNPHKEIPPEDILTQKDVILITYGDQIRSEGEKPLQTLADFVETYLQNFISTIHLLPFFPYSSDDGFSVIDYRQVDPALGSWEHIEKIRQCCDLMFDAVINHISRKSAWFQRFREGEEPYDEYFITVDPDTDLSQVVRPRALPLLTPVETEQGVRHVWTTFSNDQIDLNFSNPDVMVEIIDLLLFYIEHGAQIIRLDAIAYLWKEIGTSCIHLPQTHHVVKLFRAILDLVAPDVILITETNVPHEENISYFGDALDSGTGGEAAPRGDEAQMVYQFPLAPLVLHTFHVGDAHKLTEWAATLEAPFANTTFFNFIASHDGIGVRPAEGILTDEEVQALVDRTMAHDGHVSYKTNQDGSKSVYELNITLFDALNDPKKPDHRLDLKRFLASQAIMLTLAGVPGIYVHSLFGSRNCHTCVEETGRARSINREKFQREALEAFLADPESLGARVYNGYAQLLTIRRQHQAFHPQGEQQILSLDKRVFAVLRTAPDRSEQILCLTNVTDQTVRLRLAPSGALPRATQWHDLFSDVNVDIPADIELPPYQVFWLLRA